MQADVLEIPKKRGKYGEGSCYQRKDNQRWEISFYDREGRRRRKSFSTQVKARKALTSMLALKEANKLDAPEGRTRIENLATAYLRYVRDSKPKSYKWADRTWRKHLQPFFGDRLASRLDSELLNDYMDSRKKGVPVNEIAQRKRNSTINRELAVLKAAYNHGAEMDPPLVTRVPRFPAKLRESDPRSGWLSDEQYDKLQDACKETWLRALLAIAFTFGLRKGELLELKVGQVDLKDRTIKLPPGTTKNDRGRTIKMTDEVHTLLKPCLEGKRLNDFVFTWSDESQVKDFRVTWQNMCDRAGVQINLHDFRRTAVRNLVRSGVSKMTAKKISGHQSDAVFDRYDIQDESDLADAAAKLEARKKNGRS